MQMKKKLALAAVMAAMLIVLSGSTAPVSATSVCSMEATSFEIWFIQLFYC